MRDGSFQAAPMPSSSRIIITLPLSHFCAFPLVGLVARLLLSSVSGILQCPFLLSLPQLLRWRRARLACLCQRTGRGLLSPRRGPPQHHWHCHQTPVTRSPVPLAHASSVTSAGPRPPGISRSPPALGCARLPLVCQGPCAQCAARYAWHTAAKSASGSRNGWRATSCTSAAIASGPTLATARKGYPDPSAKRMPMRSDAPSALASARAFGRSS